MSRSHNRNKKARKAYQWGMQTLIEEQEREHQKWEKRQKVEHVAPVVFIAAVMVAMVLVGLFCSNKEIARTVFEYIAAGTMIMGVLAYMKAVWWDDPHWQSIAYTLIGGAPVIFYGARAILV